MSRTELVKIISDGKPDPADPKKKDEPRRAPKTVRRIARGLEVSEDVARTAAGLLPLASVPLLPGSIFVEGDGSAYTNKDGNIVRMEDDAGNAFARKMHEIGNALASKADDADDALVRQMREAVRKGEAAKAFLEAYYKTKPDGCAKCDDEGGATMKQ